MSSGLPPHLNLATGLGSVISVSEVFFYNVGALGATNFLGAERRLAWFYNSIDTLFFYLISCSNLAFSLATSTSSLAF